MHLRVFALELERVERELTRSKRSTSLKFFPRLIGSLNSRGKRGKKFRFSSGTT